MQCFTLQYAANCSSNAPHVRVKDKLRALDDVGCCDVDLAFDLLILRAYSKSRKGTQVHSLGFVDLHVGRASTGVICCRTFSKRASGLQRSPQPGVLGNNRRGVGSKRARLQVGAEHPLSDGTAATLPTSTQPCSSLQSPPSFGLSPLLWQSADKALNHFRFRDAFDHSSPRVSTGTATFPQRIIRVQAETTSCLLQAQSVDGPGIIEPLLNRPTACRLWTCRASSRLAPRLLNP
jgi:hypothetical protein